MDATAELEAIGIGAERAAAIAAVVAQPPAGMLDVEDAAAGAPPPTRALFVLRAALVASRELRRFADEIRAMLDWLEGQLVALSAYDVARFWHLRGALAWRVDDAPFVATRVLNTSARMLTAEATPRASAYLARVHDTFGQLLHQQGMLADARRELERSLALRDRAHDTHGAAITLGNLGRLCMELGDVHGAAEYLARDLAIVAETSPGALGVRAQLLSHLADCQLQLGAIEQAAALLAQSAALARDANDTVAEIFAALGVGKVALARADAPSALRAAAELTARLEAAATPSVPPAIRIALLAAATKLAADARLASRDYDRAIDDYRDALAQLGLASGSSPIQYAEAFRGLATALAAREQGAEAARNLRHALRHLDATAADALRLEIEHDLQRTANDSWLLHAAGRFIGQQHIEFLLNEGGKLGFRGKKRHVVVLFSDIRGFTTLSERLAPDELIVFLNDFLSHMTRCIERHGGMVDKFIGDAVMAVFPDDERTGTRAIDAGLAMRDELERFNRGVGTDMPPLSIGVGIHGGEVVAGLIGSPQKREYTVIGDVVNTASRLEGMTKQLGATALVSSAIVTDADRARYLLRPLGTFSPKGRKRGLAVFDVMGERDRSPASQAIAAEITRVEAALAALTARDFTQAAAAFDALERDFAGTARVAGYTLLAAKARELAASPPPADWAGEIVLSEK